MASNPPYKLANNSQSIIFFGINHNDNYIDSFAIKPGEYLLFDTLDEGVKNKFYLSDDLEQDRLKNDLLNQVGDTLTLTDKDGNNVTAAQYNADNPDSDSSGGSSGGGSATASKDFEESTWTDGTNYYVRRTVLDESSGTYATTFTNPDGSPANPDLSTIYPFAKDVDNPPLTYTSVAGSPFTLTANWQKVVTTNKNTKGLRISPLASATTFDIEWISVAAGSTTPTDAVGEPIMGGEDFAGGVPIGDIYLKSASGQTAIVKIGA